MSMRQPAPYCGHTMGGGLHCYRRTKHESGLCPQHRPGLNGRGQEPMSTRGILACEVDETGGMAEIAAAEALLAAAHGPGKWVADQPIRCDYCGDPLPSVSHRSHVPTTPDLQRLGFDADKVVCPGCVASRRDAG